MIFEYQRGMNINLLTKKKAKITEVYFANEKRSKSRVKRNGN